MKRIITVLLAICLVLALSACNARSKSNNEPTEPGTTAGASSTPVEPASTSTQEPNSEDSQGISVDENLLTVEVTIPASFFEEETPEEIKAGAADSGMISCDINDDGSVTYKMTKAKHRELMASIRDGSYNDMVERELPPQHKTGTIIRSQLWAIFPDWKAEFFADISKDDVNDFLRIAEAQSDRAVANIGRLQGFTANDFFECCALGYKAIGFVVEGMTPREQYYKYADGRDNGLGEIDPVSAVAYREWYDDRHKGGGHPWEICRGGNSTHISLYVSLDDNGAYLHVAGSAVGRTIEAVKFFLALYRAGKPVLIHDAHELASRLNGTEKIGVVPADVFPRYCSSMFPDEKIIAFMNLPDEKREEVARCCVWQPLRKATLINNTGGDDA